MVTSINIVSFDCHHHHFPNIPFIMVWKIRFVLDGWKEGRKEERIPNRLYRIISTDLVSWQEGRMERCFSKEGRKEHMVCLWMEGRNRHCHRHRGTRNFTKRVQTENSFRKEFSNLELRNSVDYSSLHLPEIQIK